MEQDQQALKQDIRQRLSRLPPPTPAQVAAVIEALDEWLVQRRPRLVVGFLAMDTELDVAPLVGRRPEIRFGLTRTAPGFQLTVRPFDAAREWHRFGFEQPRGDSERLDPAEVDVVLVPGVGFTPDGRRLGRGAGYYDRFLAGIEADTVGVTTTDRILDDLPWEPHDVRVRYLATEQGVASCVGLPTT